MTTTKVYSPESGLRSPGKLLGGLFTDFFSGQHLGWRLFLRNTQAKYRKSFLGILWAILPPLVTSLVWIFLNSQKVVTFQPSGLSYPVFVITGTIIWQIFTESITGMLNIMNSNRSILVKLNFPRESLLISAGWEILFNTSIKLILLVLMLAVLGVSPSVALWQWIAGIAGVLLLGWSIGLLLIPLSMLIPDIRNSVNIIMQFLMYMTPVIYPPKEFSGYLSVLNYNPVTPILEICRSALKGITSPELPTVLILIMVSFFLILLGLIIFRLSLPIVIERMGS